jgi:hypothetical protein
MAVDRASTLRTQMDRAEKATGRDRMAALDELGRLATQVEGDAAAATGRDAARMKALADAIRARSVQLR